MRAMLAPGAVLFLMWLPAQAQDAAAAPVDERTDPPPVLVLSDAQHRAAARFRSVSGSARIDAAATLAAIFPDRLETRGFAVIPAPEERQVRLDEVAALLGPPDNKRRHRAPTPEQQAASVELEQFERWTYDLGCIDRPREGEAARRVCWELYVLFYEEAVVRSAVVGRPIFD